MGLKDAEGAMTKPSDSRRNLENLALNHEGLAEEHRRLEASHRLQAEQDEAKAATARALIERIVDESCDVIPIGRSKREGGDDAA